MEERYRGQDERAMERQGTTSAGEGRTRSSTGSSGEGGEWYGYVQPYRYYGPGYRGVGYYSVLYHGGQQEEQGESGGRRSQDYEQRQGQGEGTAWPSTEAFSRGGSSERGADTGYGGGEYASGGERGSSARSGSWSSGQHVGKGPKGYRRSDERIREDISDRLMEHGQIDASDIEVEVRDGEVTLTGMVDDRRAKRLAEDLAEQCSGVRDVMNQLRVRDGSRSEEGNGMSTRSSSTSGSSRQSSGGSSSDRSSSGKRQEASRQRESSGSTTR